MSMLKRGGAFSWLALAAIAFTLASAPARAQTPVETFVQTNVQKGLQILNDKSLSPDQMRAQFRDFLISLTDLKRIALFTLGPARRTATVADQNAFIDAFKDYAVAVYESHLSQYSGQSLKVTGSTEVQAGDWVVKTELVDPSPKAGDQPVEVDFRVQQENGHFVVLDASVVNVWLAQEEQDEFNAFLAQNNNSVPALIGRLKALTAALKNGGGGKQPT